jgi:hypothetical protein
MDDIRQQVPDMARAPGGVGKVAQLLRSGANIPTLSSQAVLDGLKQKHPAGATPHRRLATTEAARATVDRARVEARDGQRDPAAPAVHFTPFTAKAIRDQIMGANAGSSGGPSGLSYEHLQAMLKFGGAEAASDLLAMLVELSTLVFSQAHLFPQAFWDTHRAARLSAVGEKGRPVACGDIFRRIWGGLVCRVVRSKAAPRFSRAGQVGVGVSGGVEIVSTTAQLVHEAGG